jgi:hypothetical protein
MWSESPDPEWEMLPALLRQKEREEARRRPGLGRLGNAAVLDLAARAEMRRQREEQEAEEADWDLLHGDRGYFGRPSTSLSDRAGGAQKRGGRPARPPAFPLRSVAQPAGIVPRAKVKPGGPFSPEHYAPLPVLFPPVQDARADTHENPTESAASGAPESTMGHCPDVGMSTTMTPEQREAWRRELKGLTDAELKKRFVGELRTHKRILRDAKDGKSVVAERWQSFRRFMDDMGPKPTPSHTLDRINPRDPVYGPGKCRWLDKVGQARNRTSNVFLRAAWKGEVLTLTIAEWAERTGQNREAIYKRHQRRAQRSTGEADWQVIRGGAGPTPDEAPAAPPHPLPPGWNRCPRAFALFMERQGKTSPPKAWVMFHLEFQKAVPREKRALATVPVFLAWCAREHRVADEDTLLRLWGLDAWAGSGYVPRRLLGTRLLDEWLSFGAIRVEAEAMLTDAEREFLESLRLEPALIVNRHRVPIHDWFAALRHRMEFAKAPPSAEG